MSWGIVDGVTTNPSLIKKAVIERKNVNMESYITNLLKTVYPNPVSLEVISTEADDMIREARTLDEKFGRKMGEYGYGKEIRREIGSNVVVKIPVNTAFGRKYERFEGIKAIKKLEGEGIRTNATLVMTPEQALMAAKAGASYVSPFLGRVDDYVRKSAGIEFSKPDYWSKELLDEKDINNGIRSGVELLESIIKIFNNYDFDTEIIAASMRNARQVREAAELGVDIATIPFPVIRDMMDHPKTKEGMKKFTEDVVPEYKAIFMG